MSLIKTARLERHTRSGQFSINVKYVDGYDHNLWEGLIEYCCKTHSDNELIEIYKQCNEQLRTMNPNDVPQMFTVMMKDMQVTLIKRHCFNEDKIEVKENEHLES
jgi:hypothetical protein